MKYFKSTIEFVLIKQPAFFVPCFSNAFYLTSKLIILFHSKCNLHLLLTLNESNFLIKLVTSFLSQIFILKFNVKLAKPLYKCLFCILS